MAKDEKKEFIKCEKCNASVNALNMLEHMAKAHNDEAAKQAIAYIDMVKGAFTQKSFEQFVETKLEGQKLPEQELRVRLNELKEEFIALGSVATRGLATEGMKARQVLSTPPEEVAKLSDLDEIAKRLNGQNVAEYIKKAKEYKKATLKETVAGIRTSSMSDQEKAEMAQLMIALTPDFFCSAWKETYGKKCATCKMAEFKQRMCEKGSFVCVYDFDFEGLVEEVLGHIINGVIEGKDENPEDVRDAVVKDWVAAHGL